MEKYLTLVDLLRDRANSEPDKTAYTWLRDGKTEAGFLTYQQIDRRAREIAAFLQSLSVSEKPVLLLYPPGLELIPGFFGCLSAGAIAISASPPGPNQSTSRIGAIASDSQAEVVLTTQSILPYLKARFAESPDLAKIQLVATDGRISSESGNPHPVTANTLACLAYTSGSTGTPKGIMLGHGNILENLAGLQERVQFTPESKLISWMPFDHNSGIVGGILVPLYNNFPAILMSPLDFMGNPLSWLETMSRYRGTFSLAPNFAYNLVCSYATPEYLANLDLSSWDVALWGSEPVRADIVERFFTTFAPCGLRREAFTSSYGLSEVVSLATATLKNEGPIACNVEKKALEQNRAVLVSEPSEQTKQILGSGRALPNQDIRIVNPQTLTSCRSDEIGEIWISSPCAARGYWNRPEATEGAFEGKLADTGDGPFLRTGDLGFFLNGELFITGRLKEMIIIRGRNHYPQDIEKTVEKSHPALQPNSSAAFSIDVDNEEKLVAIAEIQENHLPQLDADGVTQSIREAVSGEHSIQAYQVVLLKPGTIPKSPTGKILRSSCREAFLNGSFNPLT